MIVLLPYSSKKRYLYFLDLENLSLGILKTKKWNSKIKGVVPYGVEVKVPILLNKVYGYGGRSFLSGRRYRITYRTPAWLKKEVKRRFRYMIFEEPRPRTPATAFRLLKDACKQLHNYYIISDKKVVAGGFERKGILVSRFLILRYTAVMLT